MRRVLALPAVFRVRVLLQHDSLPVTAVVACCCCWILLICWHLNAAWLEIPAVRRGRQVPAAKQLKLVYLRALSLLDTWIDAVVHWICSDQNVACSLDIYAPRLDPETAQFLLSRQGDRLRLHHEGIEYDRLPHVLPQYDVGLILYRCRTINFVHNAPNKLFEYLMCGHRAEFLCRVTFASLEIDLRGCSAATGAIHNRRR